MATRYGYLSLLTRLPDAVRQSFKEEQSHEEHLRMERVQTALVQLSQITLEANNLGELYRTIHAVISNLMPAQNFYISLYDETTGMVSYPYYIDEYDTTPSPEPLSRGLTAYLIRTGRPLLATPKVFDNLVASGEVELEGAASIDWLGVPLKVKGKTIGVLAVQSYTKEVRFTSEDQQILEFVSNQIGIAIHRKRAEVALEAESRFRKAIENSILAGVMATDLEGSQSYVNPAFCRMLGWSEVELLGAKPPFVYWPEEEMENISNAFRVATSDDGLPSDFELVFQRRNGERFDAYLLVSPLTGEDGNLTGWLSSVYDVTARKKSEEDARRQKAHAEALVRIASRLNARLNLQTVFDMVCEETARALRAPFACLFIFEPDSYSLHMRASCGFPRRVHERIQPRLSIDRLVAGSSLGGTFQIPDLQALNDISNADLIAEFGIHRCAGLWLTQSDRVIGLLLAMDKNIARIFSVEELALLQGIGDQAIQAIVNAGMFTELEGRLERLRNLNIVDRSIDACFDLRNVLRALLDYLVKMLSVDTADILQYHSTRQELEFIIGREIASQIPADYHNWVTSNYARRVVLECNPVIVNLLADPPRNTEVFSSLRREGFVSYYAVPINVRGQVAGVLEILSRKPIQMVAHWRDMVETFAAQAAWIIENIVLFNDLQHTRRELMAAFDSTMEGWMRAIEFRDPVEDNPG